MLVKCVVITTYIHFIDYPECHIYLKLTKKPFTFHLSNYWQHPVPILWAWPLITGAYSAYIGDNVYTLLCISDEKGQNMWQGKEDRLSIEKLKGYVCPWACLVH